jgi:hypothetical protein
LKIKRIRKKNNDPNVKKAKFERKFSNKINTAITLNLGTSIIVLNKNLTNCLNHKIEISNQRKRIAVGVIFIKIVLTTRFKIIT